MCTVQMMMKNGHFETDWMKDQKGDAHTAGVSAQIWLSALIPFFCCCLTVNIQRWPASSMNLSRSPYWNDLHAHEQSKSSNGWLLALLPKVQLVSSPCIRIVFALSLSLRWPVELSQLCRNHTCTRFHVLMFCFVCLVTPHKNARSVSHIGGNKSWWFHLQCEHRQPFLSCKRWSVCVQQGAVGL